MMLKNLIKRNFTSSVRRSSALLSKNGIITSSTFVSHQRLDTKNNRFTSSSAIVHDAIRIGMTIEQRQKFYEMGYVDDRSLLCFDNLHDMQLRACDVFSTKNLFSTYSEESKKFEWMTFNECKYSFNYFYFFLASVFDDFFQKISDFCHCAPIPFLLLIKNKSNSWTKS